jgi:hypothetical protein
VKIVFDDVEVAFPMQKVIGNEPVVFGERKVKIRPF